MQYIKKKNIPSKKWATYFKKGDGGDEEEDSYIYTQAHPDLKKYLLEEQNGLCAYCQREININTSTVEHILPQSLNKELSTNYHNLVLVCSGSTAGEKHCDKARGNQFIINLIFSNKAGLHIKKEYDDVTIRDLKYDQILSKWSNLRLNAYFEAYADGSIAPSAKPNIEEPNLKTQIQFFIDTLNLNHEILKADRSNAIKDLDKAANGITDKQQLKKIWQRLFLQILRDPKRPFRQFLLLYIGKYRKLNLT